MAYFFSPPWFLSFSYVGGFLFTRIARLRLFFDDTNVVWVVCMVERMRISFRLLLNKKSNVGESWNLIFIANFELFSSLFLIGYIRMMIMFENWCWIIFLCFEMKIHRTELFYCWLFFWEWFSSIKIICQSDKKKMNSILWVLQVWICLRCKIFFVYWYSYKIENLLISYKFHFIPSIASAHYWTWMSF